MGNAEINAPGSYSVSVDTDWKEMAVIFSFVSTSLNLLANSVLLLISIFTS